MKYVGTEMQLDNLFKHVMECKREDIVAPASKIVMHKENDTFNLGIAGTWNLPVNAWGQQQMNNRLAAGLNTFQREIPEELYIHNVNELMRYKGDEKMVMRTLANGQSQHIRAVVSEQYMPIDNNVILPEVIEMFGKYSNRWKAIGGFPTDVRTYCKFVEKEPAFTLTDIHGNKREYRMGVMWKNSEVGAGYMEFVAYVIDGFCNNGVMFNKLTIADCKFMHKGSRITTDLGVILGERVQRAKLEEIRGLVVESSRVAAEGRYNEEIKQIMEQSLTMKLEGADRTKAIDAVFKKVGLSEKESTESKLRIGGDFSAFELQAAVTNYAQEVPDYDRKVQLEEAGGNIVTMSPNVWKSIAALSN